MMKQALLTLRHATLPRLVVAGLLAGSAISAHAALFGDDEARRAIIELRQRVAGIGLVELRLGHQLRQHHPHPSPEQGVIVDQQDPHARLLLWFTSIRGG